MISRKVSQMVLDHVAQRLQDNGWRIAPWEVRECSDGIYAQLIPGERAYVGVLFTEESILLVEGAGTLPQKRQTVLMYEYPPMGVGMPLTDTLVRNVLEAYHRGHSHI